MSKAINRTISVIGLGYVGLPVAVAFGKKSRVIGFDVNSTRIDELVNGIDRTGEVEFDELGSTDVLYTSNLNELSKADFHIVAVPTPIDNNKKPDLKPLLSASKTVGQILKKGDIVVYESTVYPGATEEECAAILESESGLVSGKDFFLGYSPERINPGDKTHTFKTIKKVVSAQDENTLEIVAKVYSSVVDAGVYMAASIKVAEAAKVIENTQRDLNIALMNELAVLFKRMNIDTYDVLAAAGTKWNFLPFEPGLVGGHCIGVDPYYLTHKSTLLGYDPQVILSGREINDSMGKYIADSLIDNLKNSSKKLDEVVITVLGITFKENVPDIRNTRVIDIVNELGNYPVTIQVYDPCADSQDVKSEYQIDLVELDDLDKADAVILAVPHNDFVKQGWKLISELLQVKEGVVYDIKSILDRDTTPENINLIRL
ncbi:MAG: nucleotide sugar dehydrogenase [Proteobacteria bacterium]|nr:nucleotide sugar dehydrogenase [Pseudomonadota bacterium]NOG59051.1 nucleotide sugar dehydrogenase [Pseudomonadota bacterium]